MGEIEKEEPLVSIIMPAYNAAGFIKEAIHSVLNQSYAHWELIIINDGSSDNTNEIIGSIGDRRIRYVEQENKGVSAARNAGLGIMKGDFLCFLDADDAFTPNSIKDRINILKKKLEVCFVDGIVYVTGGQLNNLKYKWSPSYKGMVTNELVRIKETCFVTLSWMIRKSAWQNTYFETGLSHAEDLLFLTEISKNGRYDFTSSPILFFRRTGFSAMANYDGLASGYTRLYSAFKSKKLFTGESDRLVCKLKIMKIMFLTFWTAKRYRKAFEFCFNFVLQ